MKMMKKSICLLMALLLAVSFFTACTSTDAPAADSGSGGSEAIGALSYPYAEEPTNLTATVGLPGFMPLLIDTQNGFYDIVAFKAACEATNIYVEVNAIDQDAYMGESFYLIIAGGELPDFMSNPDQYYQGGKDGLVDDGLFYDLLPYIEEGMPNFYEYFSATEEYRKETLSDNGILSGIWSVPVSAPSGAAIRKDWLDELGMEIPETYDELTAVLTAFKTEYNTRNTIMMLNKLDVSNNQNCLSSGFGVAITGDNDLPWQVDDDGNVQCSLLLDGFEEFISLLSGWYADGLFSDDFLGIKNPGEFSEHVVAGESGYWHGGISIVGSSMLAQSNGEIYSVAAPDVTKTANESTKLGNDMDGITVTASLSISTSTIDLDAAMAWLNWFWTDEGSFVSNYGIENEAFTYDENGDMQFTDFIMANENGFQSRWMLYVYTTYDDIPYLQDYQKVAMQFSSDEDKEAYDIWSSGKSSEWVYHGDMTAEESQSYSNIASDIITFSDENLLAFVVGGRDMSEWDSFIDSLYDFGIEDLYQYKQAAYDRYMSR